MFFLCPVTADALQAVRGGDTPGVGSPRVPRLGKRTGERFELSSAPARASVAVCVRETANQCTRLCMCVRESE